VVEEEASIDYRLYHKIVLGSCGEAHKFFVSLLRPLPILCLFSRPITYESPALHRGYFYI